MHLEALLAHLTMYRPASELIIMSNRNFCLPHLASQVHTIKERKTHIK
jgi:hypothetical protein